MLVDAANSDSAAYSVSRNNSTTAVMSGSQPCARSLTFANHLLHPGDCMLCAA